MPIFCVITAKYTVNCQIFALNLKKFTRAKKKLHEYIRGVRGKYQVWLMLMLMLMMMIDEDTNANAKNNLLKGDEEEKAAEAGEKVATVQEQGLNF